MELFVLNINTSVDNLEEYTERMSFAIPVLYDMLIRIIPENGSVVLKSGEARAPYY